MYREVIKRFNAAGYQAYLVGGSVRDMIMGREIFDYDICTSALPKEVYEVFSEEKIFETGIKHGTVTLLYKDIPFEITVFRKETGYSDHRHPDKVIFGATLEDDLVRRDFTINAICYDGEKYIDRHGGIQDIENRIIRAVGDPEKRFSEDALRILRGLRFASVLGFEIEPETLAAMERHAFDINAVSAERIFTEFKKAAAGNHFTKVYEKYYDIFKLFIPLAAPVKSVFKNAQDAVNALQTLKADKKSVKLAKDYFTYYNCKPIEMLKNCGKENALYICAKRGIAKELEAVISEGTPYTVSMLAINGNDLLPLVEDKTRIHEILNTLLDEVMSKKMQNKREILLQKVVDIL